MTPHGAQAPTAPPAKPKVRPAKPAEKVETDPKDVTKLAPRYRVLIHNDDVTPMDFVEKAHALARTAKFPLTFSYEPEQ